jgi:hypothetical protein
MVFQRDLLATEATKETICIINVQSIFVELCTFFFHYGLYIVYSYIPTNNMDWPLFDFIIQKKKKIEFNIQSVSELFVTIAIL